MITIKLSSCCFCQKFLFSANCLFFSSACKLSKSTLIAWEKVFFSVQILIIAENRKDFFLPRRQFSMIVLCIETAVTCAYLGLLLITLAKNSR